MDSMCVTNGTGAGETAWTDVIDPVDSDEWAAPIVLVVMSDCSVQIYGSYSLSSQAAKADSYPPQGWKNFLLHWLGEAILKAGSGSGLIADTTQ